MAEAPENSLSNPVSGRGDRVAAPAPLPRVTRAAWVALTLVCLTQAMSMVDRQILAILLPRIKADLHVGDAEMGILYGSVFALFYALFSLPLGRLADGWRRGRLIGVSIAGWSLATALGGTAQSFAVLAVSRLGVGVGEASVQPAGLSLLSDHFPRARRGFTGAMVAASIALGLGGALWIGGATADAWDAAFATAGSAPFGLRGWQAAFIVVALPGLILSVLLWRLPEPERGRMDGIACAPDPAPFAAAGRTLAKILPVGNWLGFARSRAGAGTWAVNLAALVAIVIGMAALTDWTDGLRRIAPPPLRWGPLAIGGNAVQWAVTGFGLYVVVNWLQQLRLSDPPAFAVIARTPALLLLFTIAALQSVVNYGVMAWTPTYIMQRFHESSSSVGAHFGLLTAGLGIVGPLIAGPLSDRLNGWRRGARIWVTAGALLVSPVLAFWAYSADTLDGFYARFVFYSLILTMWIPPVYATFMDLVLPRMRGAVVSFYILTMTIFGLGIGPYAVGIVSDVNGGRLAPAILSLYWLAPVLAVLVVWLTVIVARDESRVVARARAAGEAI